MERIAVFPGSFDPLTKGHEEIIRRALPLFDKIIIGFGVNESKKYFFTTESRLAHAAASFADEPKVEVMKYSKLTVDFCMEVGAPFILRGIRNMVDMEYERSIADTNKHLAGIETVFMISEPRVSAISSSIVREIFKNGANIEAYVTNPDKLVITSK